MKAMQKFAIKLDREEKTKLDEAAEVMENVLALLKTNRANGWTAFQEGLEIYDSFWKIYNMCKIIELEELIP